MAKRRKLMTPSASDLDQIEQEFRNETSVRPHMAAPISQVAADAADAYDPRSLEARAQTAKDSSDAKTLRASEAKGLILKEIPLTDIHDDALVRDRVVLDAEEMNELKLSIAKGGLRLPIEVFELSAPDAGRKYGLLSGYRRFHAIQSLKDLSKDTKYDTIKAIVRNPDAMGGTFAAMIEENEIRSALSHFERGRISVIAAQQGAFPNTEAAVNGLFPMASKAKRSKIRSFALIFEELGDMLTFPDKLKERDGLKVAAALRDGQEAKLREALAETVPTSPTQEAQMIEVALAKLTPAPVNSKKGGRPKSEPAATVLLQSGVELSSTQKGQNWVIQLKGADVNKELVDLAMSELARLLDVK